MGWGRNGWRDGAKARIRDMKDHNYITIQGWMVNRLKLSGNELLAYAIIYGFSHDGKSQFMGSGQYLADALGVSRRSIVAILTKLVDRGFIKQRATEKTNVRGQTCQVRILGFFNVAKATGFLMLERQRSVFDVLSSGPQSLVGFYWEFDCYGVSCLRPPMGAVCLIF